MTDSVFPLMFDRFMTLYGAPNTGDVRAFIGEYANALRGFSDPVLLKATGKIVANHGFSSWPVLGECVRVCREVAEELTPRPKPDRMPEKEAPPAGKGDAILGEFFLPSIYARNAFPDIVARCPIGGKINMQAPWGKEVTNAEGRIVPIRRSV